MGYGFLSRVSASNCLRRGIVLAPIPSSLCLMAPVMVGRVDSTEVEWPRGKLKDASIFIRYCVIYITFIRLWVLVAGKG